MARGRSSNESPSGGPLVAALVVYVPLAVAMVTLCRHQLNVDGVSYIRQAGHYAALDFDLAVSGHWPPLLSWLLIPWRLAGGDTVLGGHVINAVAGVLFIASVHYLARAFRVRGPIAWAMPLGSGLLALSWQGRGIYADILLAAVLTFYFACSHRMTQSLRVRDALLTGIVGGIAYLTKYYALPFFLLHHTLATLVLGRRTLGRRPGLQHLKCWVFGTFTCLFVASPWLVTLSVRYGRPTFSTSGRIAHSLSGPEVPAGDYWPLYRLMTPRAGRINNWENPDEISIPYPKWSLLEGPRGLVHQLRLLYRNTGKIAALFFGADGLGLMYCAALLMPLMACLPAKNSLGQDPRQWRWALVAVGAYLSGLILIFAGSQRYYWALQGLLLVLVGSAASGAASVLASDRHGASRLTSPRFWQMWLAGVIVLAAALPLVQTARRALSRPGLDLQGVAHTLSDLGVEGPIASNHWHRALVIAYHLDTVCVGVPMPGSAEEVMEQLAGVGARSFLMFEDEAQPAGAAALQTIASDLALPYNEVHEGSVRLTVYALNRTPGGHGDNGSLSANERQ